MPTRTEDEFYEVDCFFDTDEYKAEVAVAEAFLRRAARPQNLREIREGMGKKYSGKFPIGDILLWLDVQEVGVAPVKYQLTEKLPVKQYTDAEKRAYWNSTFKRGEKLYFPFAK